jgi:glycerol uptake facilitator-like aquaporin
MNTDNKEEKGIKNHSLKFKFLVELVGTFILVYAICSAATVYADRSQLGVIGLGQLGIIGIGLVHALV